AKAKSAHRTAIAAFQSPLFDFQRAIAALQMWVEQVWGAVTALQNRSSAIRGALTALWNRKSQRCMAGIGARLGIIHIQRAMTALWIAVLCIWRALTALQMRKTPIRSPDTRKSLAVSPERVREAAVQTRHPEDELREAEGSGRAERSEYVNYQRSRRPVKSAPATTAPSEAHAADSGRPPRQPTGAGGESGPEPRRRGQAARQSSGKRADNPTRPEAVTPSPEAPGRHCCRGRRPC